MRLSEVPKRKNSESNPGCLVWDGAADWDITELMRDFKIKYLRNFADPG